jgi:cytochrome c oxidase assembly factor CtaG
LINPMRATLLLGITMWLWHAPALFGAAVAYDWVHALQHLSFFVPALLFWRGLIHARPVGRAPGAVAAAFITFMHTGLLGGLITMAPEPLSTAYLGRTESWGLSALADQQLAGLLMWVPLGVPYVAAGLLLGARVFGGDQDEARIECSRRLHGTGDRVMKKTIRHFAICATLILTLALSNCSGGKSRFGRQTAEWPGYNNTHGRAAFRGP